MVIQAHTSLTWPQFDVLHVVSNLYLTVILIRPRIFYKYSSVLPVLRSCEYVSRNKSNRFRACNAR